MTKIELTKATVNLVVGVGTGKIVGQIIKNNAQPQTMTDLVTMTAAAGVMGGMAADASKAWTNAQIDGAVAWWNENVKKNQK